eukprot:scaffold3556_cov190-Cylindrotheca_fusiformis.AAC.2
MPSLWWEMSCLVNWRDSPTVSGLRGHKRVRTPQEAVVDIVSVRSSEIEIRTIRPTYGGIWYLDGAMRRSAIPTSNILTLTKATHFIQIDFMRGTTIVELLTVTLVQRCSDALIAAPQRRSLYGSFMEQRALSSDFAENDLVAVMPVSKSDSPRLCVVRPDNTVLPLCQHEDDVETDLFVDPRFYNNDENNKHWEQTSDEAVKGRYGEGWYGQRPVPSLGGGPGYGAEAQEIWSIDEDTLAQLKEDNVELPILDMGIAHGEKARGGAF